MIVLHNHHHIMYRYLFKQFCSRCLLGAASTASWEEGICGGDGLGYMRGASSDEHTYPTSEDHVMTMIIQQQQQQQQLLLLVERSHWGLHWEGSIKIVTWQLWL